ncbi:OX-2 membrane glycoprotein-like [Lampris incognitus]|uniref:OX-2 membrane glycoprotein-like n=1 Tax=Lampris incognitus TaxID=2546036 RepID=UPI0024B4DB11|nr:OX-2 membrane glycoprotein-like [Lampris incognitus]
MELKQSTNITQFKKKYKGLPELIRTQGIVKAAVGEQAHLRCQLLESRDVVQVTWQKILPDGVDDIATYSNFSGSKVNLQYQEKVKIQHAGLQNISIIINRVEKQDECCYMCLFNAFPEGSLTEHTCLKVYEQHEPILRIMNSNSAVSCSATGQPPPTVMLKIPGQAFCSSNYTTDTLTNPNGTVTVTASATLLMSKSNCTQVGCVVHMFSGDVRELSETFSNASRTPLVVLSVQYSC